MVIAQGRPAEEGSADVIIVITEGASSSVSRTSRAADRARGMGITVFDVTVGTGFSRSELAGVTDNDPNLHMAIPGACGPRLVCSNPNADLRLRFWTSDRDRLSRCGAPLSLGCLLVFHSASIG